MLWQPLKELLEHKPHSPIHTYLHRCKHARATCTVRSSLSVHSLKPAFGAVWSSVAAEALNHQHLNNWIHRIYVHAFYRERWKNGKNECVRHFAILENLTVLCGLSSTPIIHTGQKPNKNSLESLSDYFLHCSVSNSKLVRIIHWVRREMTNLFWSGLSDH